MQRHWPLFAGTTKGEDVVTGWGPHHQESYDPKAFVGVRFTGEKIKTYQYASTEDRANLPLRGRSARGRITNDRDVVTYHYSLDDGQTWKRHPTRMEVFGLNHNVFGGFLSLRVGICVLGFGSVQLGRFGYTAIKETL